MKRLKTAIIGCGAIAEREHIPAAIKVPEIDLVALIDLDLERAKNLANKFGVKQYYQDVQDVLDSIELAIVSTPNSSHSPISCECLSRGIHVLCEKPMATSVKECESMMDASKSGQAKLMVGHYMRYISNMRIAREFIMENIIRNIRAIECHSGYAFHWPSVSKFYNSYEKSGGGVLIDWGVNLIDVIYWLTGQEFRLLRYRVNDSIISEVEKDVEVELEQANGVICKMTLSRTKRFVNKLQFYGENAWLNIDLDSYQNLEFSKYGDKSSTNDEPMTIVGEKYDPYLRQLEDFVQSIIEDKTPSISGIDGLRTLRLIESCYKFLSVRKEA